MLSLTAALSLALLFLWASAHKFADLATFAATLGDYELLPAASLRPAAALTALLEAATGVGLLFATTRPPAALLAMGLLLTYAIAIAINVNRGRTHIDCGCGGRSLPLSYLLPVRNLLLTVPAAVCLLPVGGRATGLLDVMTVAAAVGAFALAYAGANMLIGFRLAMQAWEQTND